MNKLYISGNYIIRDDGSRVSEYAQSKTAYTEENAVLKMSEQGGGAFSIALADAGTWFDEAGVTAYDATTLLQFFRSATASSGETERFVTPIDVTVGGQTLLINTTPLEGKLMGFEISGDGVNGDGGTVGIYQANVPDTGIGVVIKQVGGNLSVIGSGQDFDPGGEVSGDYLFVVFLTGTATLGTITVRTTVKK